MALSKETQEWLDGLKKEGNLSDEVIASLKAAAESNSKTDEYVKGSVLRQSDYSRQMSEIQKAQKAVEDSQRALADKEAAVTKFQTELGTWKAGAETNYNKALAEREAAERKANAAFGKLKTIAAANGLDEAELLKDLDVTPSVNDTTKQPTFDTSRFITRDNLEETARQSALLESIIGDLADRHLELFGKRMNRKEFMVDALKSGKPIEQFFDEKFKVKEKEAELNEAAVQKRIADAVTAKENELRSTIPNIPQPRPGDDDAYHTHKIFQNKNLADSIKKVEPDQGGEGVSAAVAAFQSGKYRQSITGGR